MIRRMVLVAWVLPLLLAAGAADAQTVRKAREEVEMSLLVRGHVDINREGRVTAHALEQPDQLPGYVVDLVADSMPQLASAGTGWSRTGFALSSRQGQLLSAESPFVLRDMPPAGP